MGQSWEHSSTRYLSHVEKTEDFRINYINPLFLSIRESKLTIAGTLEAIEIAGLSEEEKIGKIAESEGIVALIRPSLIELRKSVLAFIHNGFSIDMSTASFYSSVLRSLSQYPKI